MKAVDWVEGKIRFLDQTLLPHEERYVDTDDVNVVGEAIRALRIRGAPAIGVAAAFGVLMAARQKVPPGRADLRARVHAAIDYLAGTRPTAVNLFAALARMKAVIDRNSTEPDGRLAAILEDEALTIQNEDIDACRRIGLLGATLVPRGASILTHCNAGALATAGNGTALSVITTAALEGNVVRVYVDETRPLLQGARLTSWELLKAGIPVMLITDNTAGTVLREGRVQMVIVGADRIAANGDTANKVGTYPLAVLAHRHGVPFVVAAPLSTLDPLTVEGSAIPIEQRDPSEVTHCAGVRVAPEGVGVYAPAFDVTPHELISAIVTEKGILEAPYSVSIAEILRTP